MTKKKLVNCDARVPASMKEELENIAKILKVKRSHIQRAAFQRYIDDFSAGEIIDFEEGEDGEEKRT